MPKVTKILGYNKARAWESLGFAHKKRLCQHFDTFTFAVLNITIKYKCIFEKKSCSELTLTLVLNDYRLNQTATLLIGEPSQLEL